MTFEYIVAWNMVRSRWEVLEHDTVQGSVHVLDRYLKKRPAKKQARSLAKKEEAVYISYTKDAKHDRFVAEKRDYSS